MDEDTVFRNVKAFGVGGGKVEREKSYLEQVKFLVPVTPPDEIYLGSFINHS